MSVRKGPKATVLMRDDVVLCSKCGTLHRPSWTDLCYPPRSMDRQPKQMAIHQGSGDPWGQEILDLPVEDDYPRSAWGVEGEEA